MTATTTDPHALRGELDGLRDEARARFDDEPEAVRGELGQLCRALAGSSLLDPSRPDELNLHLVRTVAGLRAPWGDSALFAGVAIAALDLAADGLDDEAYAVRYLGAARAALLLGELAESPKAATRAATHAREAAAFERLQDLARLWREFGALPWKVKVPRIAKRLGVSEATVERLHADAVRLDLPLDPLDPLV